jgi:hypothetical protein
VGKGAPAPCPPFKLSDGIWWARCALPTLQRGRARNFVIAKSTCDEAIIVTMPRYGLLREARNDGLKHLAWLFEKIEANAMP